MQWDPWEGILGYGGRGGSWEDWVVQSFLSCGQGPILCCLDFGEGGPCPIHYRLHPYYGRMGEGNSFSFLVCPHPGGTYSGFGGGLPTLARSRWWEGGTYPGQVQMGGTYPGQGVGPNFIGRSRSRKGCHHRPKNLHFYAVFSEKLVKKLNTRLEPPLRFAPLRKAWIRNCVLFCFPQ